eukprot:ctg_1881.g395
MGVIGGAAVGDGQHAVGSRQQVSEWRWRAESQGAAGAPTAESQRRGVIAGVTAGCVQSADRHRMQRRAHRAHRRQTLAELALW